MGQLSDRYDLCQKVQDKREIARLVVEAVYENGGRFLDAEGNDIGYKRSMDKTAVISRGGRADKRKRRKKRSESTQ